MLICDSFSSQMGGKFLLGPPTDYFGGDMTLKSTMLFITIALIACSRSTSIEGFGYLWIGINFVYASAWGAASKLVRQKFNKTEWPTQLGNTYHLSS
jgi:hypothetical protein